MVPEKSLGTGIGKIWYRKKVSEPVSEKFGTEKSTGIGIGNIWYRNKVSVSVSFKILGTVTHWYGLGIAKNYRVGLGIGYPSDTAYQSRCKVQSHQCS